MQSTSAARLGQPTSPASDVIEFHPHPRELPADVLAMLSAHEASDMEFGADWFANLIDTVFPQEPGACFCVVRNQTRPVLVLPLLVTTQGRSRHAHALGNYYTTLYEAAFDPGLDARRLARVFRAIVKQFPGLASFRFAPLDPESHAFALTLDALRLAGLPPFTFFCFGNWFLAPTQPWAEYLMTRSGTLRSTIRRMEKRFFGDGGTLEMLTEGEALERAIADYETVYAASWKKPEPFPEFVPGLIRLCASKGWLRLGVARLNGAPIAAQIWIISHGRAKIYKVAYREEFKNYSIGTLVSALLMQHVLDVDKVTEVDFLSGDDPYKQTWMNQRRERWGIIAYNTKSLDGFVACSRERIWRTIKPWYQIAAQFLKKIKPASR